MPKLTDKQKEFVRQYLVDLNARRLLSVPGTA